MEKTELMKILSSFSNPKMDEIGFIAFVAVLGISLLSTLFISFLYVNFSNAGSTGSKIHKSFPLLGVSITSIFICIQFSLPLSLGLLGALSIVRFRTPVKEPEEIGFIMLVIASSISCAIFNMLFLGIILMIGIVAALMTKYNFWMPGRTTHNGVLLIKIPTDQYQDKNTAIMEMIQKTLSNGRIDGIAVNEKESTISYTFSKFEISAYLKFQQDIQQIVDQAKINLFYNNPGNI